jgi:hypothetical protein
LGVQGDHSLQELRFIFHVPSPPNKFGAGHEKQNAFAHRANVIVLKKQKNCPNSFATKKIVVSLLK